MPDVRSKDTKDEFVKYLQEHPEYRFWQAVRNFSGYPFVLVSNDLPHKGEEDTFYWEGRSKPERTGGNDSEEV